MPRERAASLPTLSSGAEGSWVSKAAFRYSVVPHVPAVPSSPAAVASAAIKDDGAMSVVSTESAPVRSSSPMQPASTSGAPMAPVSQISSAHSHPGNTMPPAAANSMHPELEFYRIALRQAQMDFSADAGIFAGNLPRDLSDLQLSRLMHDHFLVYGDCWAYVQRKYEVKLGRVVEKPYALIQYANVHSALTALRHASDHKFGGRLARVEALSANRSI